MASRLLLWVPEGAEFSLPLPLVPLPVTGLPVPEGGVLLVPSSSWPSYIGALAEGGIPPDRVVLVVEAGSPPAPDAIAFVDAVVDADDPDELRRALDPQFAAVPSWAELLPTDALAELPLAPDHPALAALPPDARRALAERLPLLEAFNEAAALEALLRGIRPSASTATARLSVPLETSKAVVAAAILLALVRAGIRPRLRRPLRGDEPTDDTPDLPPPDELAEVLEEGEVLAAELTGFPLSFSFINDSPQGPLLVFAAEEGAPLSIEAWRGDELVWKGSATEGQVELPLRLLEGHAPALTILKVSVGSLP